MAKWLETLLIGKSVPLSHHIIKVSLVLYWHELFFSLEPYLGHSKFPLEPFEPNTLVEVWLSLGTTIQLVEPLKKSSVDINWACLWSTSRLAPVPDGPDEQVAGHGNQLDAALEPGKGKSLVFTAAQKVLGSYPAIIKCLFSLNVSLLNPSQLGLVCLKLHG